MITTSLTALGMTAKDTGQFVDVMTATITNSNTDIEKMGECIAHLKVA